MLRNLLPFLWCMAVALTAAEPGALIGFLGPRVYEHLYGEPFPEGVQTAEHLFAHGVIDSVVPLDALRAVVDRVLTVVTDPPESGICARKGPPSDPNRAQIAWESVEASRREDRPGVDYLLKHGATDRVLLSGTGRGESGTTLLALARFGGQPAVVVGQRRVIGGLVGPRALREARRGMALAAGLQLPLVLVIDTAGPALSQQAEEDGLAGEIARCLAELVTLDTPTVSVLLGQGSGGPALAMVPADRVLAAQNGWLAPLPPEGASAIVYRDVDHAPELAAAQGVRSADLLKAGIVDVIVPEEVDAADDPAGFTQRMSAAIAAELHALHTVPAAQRLGVTGAPAARRDRGGDRHALAAQGVDRLARGLADLAILVVLEGDQGGRVFGGDEAGDRLEDLGGAVGHGGRSLTARSRGPTRVYMP